MCNQDSKSGSLYHTNSGRGLGVNQWDNADYDFAYEFIISGVISKSVTIRGNH